MVTACIHCCMRIYTVRALYEQCHIPVWSLYRRPHSPLAARLSFSRSFCVCLSQSLCNAVHYLQLIELNQSINFQFSRTISDKYNFFSVMPVGWVRPLKTILNGLNMRSMLTYCFLRKIFTYIFTKMYQPACLCVHMRCDSVNCTKNCNETTKKTSRIMG